MNLEDLGFFQGQLSPYIHPMKSYRQKATIQHKRATSDLCGNDYQYWTWPVFYNDISFCKLSIKSMHPCKSYWMETNINSPTKPKLKRAITQPKFGRWLPISSLTCILQWYKILQSLNEINASLQKLLSGNKEQKLSQNLADDYQYRTWPVFYSDIKFCKVRMKSMPPFKSYWAETKSVRTTLMPPPLPMMRTDNMISMCLPCYAGDTKTKSKKWKQLIKNKGRITPKPHAHLQTMTNPPAKFQKDQLKTVGEVVSTSYPSRCCKFCCVRNSMPIKVNFWEGMRSDFLRFGRKPRLWIIWM